MAYEPDTAIGGLSHEFPHTESALIRTASGNGGLAREALSSVIALYWKPAYKHIRIKWRRSNEEAKDLTQAFFASLLEQDILAKFDPAQGSFRNYLRTCLDHFVLKQHAFANRLKRGGGLQPLDFESAERELSAIPAESVEHIFFREWRRQAFSLAIDDLRTYCHDHDKKLEFRVFEQYDLADNQRPRYSEVAREHGIPVTAVTNHLAWCRRELRKLVFQRLASVTSGEAELRREATALFGKQ
jgi:RNA polymerase sigma factor (sigma-70 family)